ncbi:hypothetical protein [Natronolimnohabitans innermongolicus]|uniref:Uncharacterized protein n=1 Tax=Natronolimnohabitans innermongolicus JCM 12255 TaxID=1227499 RepID=L9X9K8_9EURY|nr:hypothetical protein [Natronolimnohabitans innermongolicus]ELY58292.1 hypothetical protein C493_06944 [Natronolimnohabitans innermongolicus JCM 12255]
MSEDEPPEEQKVTSAEELKQMFQERREKNLELIRFDKCRKARDAGQVFESTTADTPGETVDQVADALNVDLDEARVLLSLYTVIYTEGGGEQIGSRSEEIGTDYFKGDSKDDLAEEYDRTIEEIQNDIRAFVGSRLRETSLDDVELDQELPDNPPDPNLKAIQSLDIKPEVSKIAAILSPKIAAQAQTTVSLFASEMEAANTLATHSLAPIVAMQEQYQEQIAGLNALFSANLEPLIQLQEQYEEIRESDFEFKWLRDVRHDSFMQLYRVYKEEGNEAAAEFLAAQLRDDEDIKEFKDYLGSFDDYNGRQPIIDEALDAHQEGRYALSIPALLSQLDGVFIDTAVEIGIWPEDIDDLTSVQVVGKGEGSPQHLEDLPEPFRQYYTRFVWPSRNDILHGRRTDFHDDELLSAKLIWLFFQTMHSVEDLRSLDDIGDMYIAGKIREEDGCELEVVASELPYQEGYVESRVRVLQRVDVVEQTSGDEFVVTEKGVRYLEGEVSLEYEAV